MRMNGGRPMRIWIGRSMFAALLIGFGGLGGGCTLVGFIGALEANRRQNTPVQVEAAYTGLDDRSFAVVINASRQVQSDYPGVVEQLSASIATRIRDNTYPSGWVPPDRVLLFQARNPGWVAMSAGDLADEFDVQRLILIDLDTFSLNDPGNPYLWAGVAAGQVSVFENDDELSRDFAYKTGVRVTFPDGEGFGPGQIPESTVQLALMKRFVDRASWLFYDHEEQYEPDY